MNKQGGHKLACDRKTHHNKPAEIMKINLEHISIGVILHLIYTLGIRTKLELIYRGVFF